MRVALSQSTATPTAAASFADGETSVEQPARFGLDAANGATNGHADAAGVAGAPDGWAALLAAVVDDDARAARFDAKAWGLARAA